MIAAARDPFILVVYSGIGLIALGCCAWVYDRVDEYVERRMRRGSRAFGRDMRRSR